MSLHLCLPLPGHRRAVRSETEVQSHQRGAGPRSQRYDFHVNVHAPCLLASVPSCLCDKLTAAASLPRELSLCTLLFTLLHNLGQSLFYSHILLIERPNRPSLSTQTLLLYFVNAKVDCSSQGTSDLERCPFNKLVKLEDNVVVQETREVSKVGFLRFSEVQYFFS